MEHVLQKIGVWEKERRFYNDCILKPDYSFLFFLLLFLFLLLRHSLFLLLLPGVLKKIRSASLPRGEFLDLMLSAKF